jgi:hypothetical protein
MSTATLTHEQLAGQLEGTADTLETALGRLDIDTEGLDLTDIEGELSEWVERCEGCDWWHHPGELTGDGVDDEPGLCDGCRS